MKFYEVRALIKSCFVQSKVWSLSNDFLAVGGLTEKCITPFKVNEKKNI